jgi:diaminopimelate decarboxylase
MDHFVYKNGILHAEDVAIPQIASKVGTPFYCYSTATLERHYSVFMDSFKDSGVKVNLCFAVKANSNLAVIKTLARLGSGGDAVSEGEIRRCLAAGIPGNKIVFSGIGKTKAELKFALENNIMQINIESEPELHALNEIAISMGVKAPVAFRVNPDVDAGSHDKISTGRKHDKFGIEWEMVRDIYKTASTMQGIKIQGVATHIGSQLTNLNPFRQAFAKLRELVENLRNDGIAITHLDLGGGLGIPYQNNIIPSPAEYAATVLKEVKDLVCELTFEPGRLICGNAGILVSEVIYIKKSSERNFLIIDAAMNDLVRPALYDSYHEIVGIRYQVSGISEDKNNDSEPLQSTARNLTHELYDVVGPICETGDVFAKQRKLPEFQPGDLLAIRSSGAYGAVMSSEYNSRLLVPEVMVHGNNMAIIRPRGSFDDMLARDKIPGWL